MKKIIYQSVLIIITLSGLTFAQTIYSNGTGGGLWSDATTWQGGVCS